jgi:diguanylate cyclase (GGDEF)-like protein
MSLDIHTLFIVSTCVVALLSLFLFFAWFQDRSTRALAWWGAAYLIGGVGVALWMADALVSPPLPYGLSNALLFLACGVIWNGARLFYGRRVQSLALSAGPIVWMIACQLPVFTQSSAGRVVLSSLIVSAYTFLTARELWIDRRKRSRSQWRAILVPVLHGLVFLPPIPLAFMGVTGQSATLLSSGWMAVFTLETLLYAVGTAFIVLMMAKERAADIHKTAAVTDTLTGLLNRRGFLERAEALTARPSKADRDVTVLMFDLDHFKSINDRFGHAVGDEALRVFAKTIQAAMREDDIVGRLGGEEFAAVLLAGSADACAAAERVRAAFEAAGVEIGGHRMGATVSIGAATAEIAGCDIAHLLSRADAGLYAAKQSGRNRVACAPDEAVLSPIRPAPGNLPAAHKVALVPVSLARAA